MLENLPSLIIGATFLGLLLLLLLIIGVGAAHKIITHA